MKRTRASLILGGISHGLAWVAFLGVTFWPTFYQGTSQTAVRGSGATVDQVTTSASIIEVNGWGVLIPLLIPVILTAVGFLATLSPSPQRTIRLISLWIVAALLLVFCFLGMFSIGIFYLPAALVLLGAAVAYSVRRSSAELLVDHL